MEVWVSGCLLFNEHLQNLNGNTTFFNFIKNLTLHKCNILKHTMNFVLTEITFKLVRENSADLTTTHIHMYTHSEHDCQVIHVSWLLEG